MSEIKQQAQLERIWRTTMAIEYLAEKEIGWHRPPGQDLHILFINDRGFRLAQNLGYHVDQQNYHWPMLVVSSPEQTSGYAVFTLGRYTVKREVFMPDSRTQDVGPNPTLEYGKHLQLIERVLRDPDAKSFVDFANPPDFNSDEWVNG